jgi:hypothetical protein
LFWGGGWGGFGVLGVLFVFCFVGGGGGGAGVCWVVDKPRSSVLNGKRTIVTDGSRVDDDWGSGRASW